MTTNTISGNDLPNEEIFGHNLARLRALKKKYDPDNMFRKWHNITPAIDIPG
jgi:FAD/FMN-containing dehydrogenase